MSHSCSHGRREYLEALWYLLKVIYWRTLYLPGDRRPEDIVPTKPDLLLETAQHALDDPLIWQLFESPLNPPADAVAHCTLVVYVHARVADILGLAKDRTLDSYDSEHGADQARADLHRLIALCK